MVDEVGFESEGLVCSSSWFYWAGIVLSWLLEVVFCGSRSCMGKKCFKTERMIKELGFIDSFGRIWKEFQISLFKNVNWWIV